jgi:4-hydroxybenzoate polyprenyltransferase
MALANYIKLTRLNQPTGIFLLLLPCLMGLALAAQQSLDFDLKELLKIATLFAIGSVIMRSAGCIINDIFDRKFDKNVARTKSRPLASGIVSLRSALILLTILLILGLIILLQFNLRTILSGFVALSLVILYPLAKRFTNYPQIILGMTFNFGVIMAALALNNNFNFATIVWTLIYDTIYAFQDIEDDLRIGVKSAAIKFAENPKKSFLICNFIMFLLLVFVGIVNKFDTNFFLAILLTSLFLDYKIQKCDLKAPENCLKTFKSNIWVGILILFAIIVG